MKIYRINDTNIPKNVSCIGFFDGVHKGHQQLINKTVEIAKSKNIEPFVITFDVSPNVFLKNKSSLQITSIEKKIELFESFGITGVILLSFNEEMMKTLPEDFVVNYLSTLNLDTLVCGFDFTYGYMGKGNSETLKSNPFFNVEVIEEYKIDGKKVSSSRIREELTKGNKVDELLGYKYE